MCVWLKCFGIQVNLVSTLSSGLELQQPHHHHPKKISHGSAKQAEKKQDFAKRYIKLIDGRGGMRIVTKAALPIVAR